MKSKALLVLLLFCFVSVASAYDGNVIYVLRNTLLAEQGMVDTLEEMGFTVDIVKNTQLDTVNWDDYEFMLVNDEVYFNPGDIPVNEVNSIILNTWHIDDFHWAKRASQYASSQPIEVVNERPGHIITNGLPEIITVYTQARSNGANIPVNYLHRYDKAPRIETIVSTIMSTIGFGTDSIPLIV